MATSMMSKSKLSRSDHNTAASRSPVRDGTRSAPTLGTGRHLRGYKSHARVMSRTAVNHFAVSQSAILADPIRTCVQRKEIPLCPSNTKLETRLPGPESTGSPTNLLTSSNTRSPAFEEKYSRRAGTASIRALCWFMPPIASIITNYSRHGNHCRLPVLVVS